MVSKGEATRERILAVAEELVFEKGLCCTSLNDIVRAAKLTKGAFFHHFPDKAALARATVERWDQKCLSNFQRFADRAAALADDPLQEALLFFKLFEEWVVELEETLPGCMFASFIYERDQHDRETLAAISGGMEAWIGFLERRFDKLLSARRPSREGVTARALAEFAASAIEGAFVLTRISGDKEHVIRQSSHIRTYLTLLFDAGG